MNPTSFQCNHIIRCAVQSSAKDLAMRLRGENPALAMAMLTGPCTQIWKETLNGSVVKR